MGFRSGESGGHGQKLDRGPVQISSGVDVTTGERVGRVVVLLVGPRGNSPSLAEKPPAPRKKGFLHHRPILLRSDIPGRPALHVLRGSLDALGARHFVYQGHAVGLRPAYMLMVLAWLTWDAVCSSEPLSNLPLPTFSPGYLDENFFRSVNSTSFQFVCRLSLAKASLSLGS